MKNNYVIIFPTDTVYGIGASIYDVEGMDRIYKIKNRPMDKPLAVLCANLEQIKEICYVSDTAQKLINAFLPGPLTIILKSKDKVKETFKHDTIGVRIPNYKLAIQILEREGAFATTSVNESGKPSINDYKLIKEEYSNLVDEIYAPTGESTSSFASTVVDLTSDKPKILREGAITIQMIEDTLTK